MPRTAHLKIGRTERLKSLKFYHPQRQSADTSMIMEKILAAEKKIIDGDYTPKNLKKWADHDLLCLTIGSNGSDRYLFKIIDIDGSPALLRLAYIENHDYQKAFVIVKGAADAHFKRHQDHLVQVDYSQYNENHCVELTQAEHDRCQAAIEQLMKTDEEIDLVFCEGQFIKLSTEQAQALESRAMIGAAGAGKTFALCTAVAEKSLEEDPEEKQDRPSIYVVENPYLASLARTETFRKHPLAEKLNVRSFTFVKLLQTLKLISDQQELVTDSHFEASYQGLLNAYETRHKAANPSNRNKGSRRKKRVHQGPQTALPPLSWSDAYEEVCRCHGRSLEQYVNLGNRQSFIDNPEDRALFFTEIYEPYIALLGTKKVNPALCPACPPELRGKVKHIGADEAQDLTYSQAKFLFDLAGRQENVSLSFDFRQILNFSMTSPEQHLTSLFGKNAPKPTELGLSQRASQIAHTIGRLFDKLKLRLNGGALRNVQKSNQEEKHQELVAPGNHYGDFFILSEADIIPLTKKNLGPQFAIITQDKHIETLRQVFPKDTIIMTPKDIKGLGYKVVLWYDLLPNDLIEDAPKILRERGAAQTKNKPKQGIGTPQWNRDLSAAHTAATRVRETLLMFDPKIFNPKSAFSEIDEIKEIAALANPNQLPDSLFDGLVNSNEAWEEEAKRRLRVDDRDNARTILENNLGWDKSKTEQFIEAFLTDIAEKPLDLSSPSTPTPFEVLTQDFQKSHLLKIVEEHSEDKAHLHSLFFNAVQTSKGDISLWQFIASDETKMRTFCQWLSEESLLVAKLPIKDLSSQPAARSHRNLFDTLLTLNTELASYLPAELRRSPPAFYAVKKWETDSFQVEPMLKALDAYSPIKNQTNQAGQPLMHYCLSLGLDSPKLPHPISGMLIVRFNCNPEQLNAEGMSTMHVAAASDCRLVWHCCDVTDASASKKNYAHQVTGWQAAHYAASCDRFANLNTIFNSPYMSIDKATAHGETPLFIAICHGHTRSIEMLLKLGVSPKRTWSISREVFVKAIEAQSDYLACSALARGNLARLKAQPDQGAPINMTAYQLAEFLGRQSVLKLFTPKEEKSETPSLAMPKRVKEIATSKTTPGKKFLASNHKRWSDLSAIRARLMQNFTFNNLVELVSTAQEYSLEAIFTEPIPSGKGKKSTLLNEIQSVPEDKQMLFFQWIAESSLLLTTLPPLLKGVEGGRAKINALEKLRLKFNEYCQGALEDNSVQSRASINLKLLSPPSLICNYSHLIHEKTPLTPAHEENIREIFHLLKVCSERNLRNEVEFLLHDAVLSNSLLIIKILVNDFHFRLDLKNPLEFTPFGDAVNKGDFKTIQFLITSYGFLIDLDQLISCKKYPAIHLAMTQKKMDIYTLLVEAGAKREYVIDHMPVTPLLWAVLERDASKTKLLLEAGEDPNYELRVSPESVNILKTKMLGQYPTNEWRDAFEERLAKHPLRFDGEILLITPYEVAKIVGPYLIPPPLNKPPEPSEKKYFTEEHMAKLAQIDSALTTLTQTFVESKEDNGAPYSVISKTLFSIINNNIDDKMFLQGLFFKKAISSGQEKISLLDFICKNHVSMEEFFAGILRQGKFMAKLPIPMMNTYRPLQSEEWETKWTKLEELQRTFLSIYKCTFEKKQEDAREVDKFLSSPPLFTAVALASGLPAIVNLRLLHACGAEMGEVNEETSLLDIIFQDSKIILFIPQLIKEKILTSSLRSKDGSNMVQLALRNGEHKLLQELEKLDELQEQFKNVDREKESQGVVKALVSRREQEGLHQKEQNGQVLQTRKMSFKLTLT